MAEARKQQHQAVVAIAICSELACIGRGRDPAVYGRLPGSHANSPSGPASSVSVPSEHGKPRELMRDRER